MRAVRHAIRSGLKRDEHSHLGRAVVAARRLVCGGVTDEVAGKLFSVTLPSSTDRDRAHLAQLLEREGIGTGGSGDHMAFGLDDALIVTLAGPGLLSFTRAFVAYLASRRTSVRIERKADGYTVDLSSNMEQDEIARLLGQLGGSDEPGTDE